MDLLGILSASIGAITHSYRRRALGAQASFPILQLASQSNRLAGKLIPAAYWGRELLQFASTTQQQFNAIIQRNDVHHCRSFGQQSINGALAHL